MPGRVLSRREGEVATVVLSNPDRRNAIDLAMWRELAAAMGDLSADGGVRCVVLAGDGEAFAAGGDLEEIARLRTTLAEARAYHGQVAETLSAVARSPHPTLAVIRGPCVGGGLEIAASCDLRLAGAGATFGVPIHRLGFSMYPGEMEGLLRLVGPAVLRELLLEGRILGAAEAAARGLVTRVVPDESLEAEAAATVRRITQGAPLVAGWHKAWIERLLHDRPLTPEELDSSFAFLGTEDYREGLAAFLEKRPPRFRGR